MEDRMEGCKQPECKCVKTTIMQIEDAVRQEGECDEVTMTYESFSSHPRHRSGPTSPRCRLSSESTEAHCLVGFHGPAKHVKQIQTLLFLTLKTFTRLILRFRSFLHE